jgi:hemerythrin
MPMQTTLSQDALWLNFEPMDSMNREWVELLTRAQGATDVQLTQAWSDLVQHAAAHFGTEDGWMRRTGYGHAEAHSLEHRVVLHLLREGLAGARGGDLAPVRQMARELGIWFKRHTQSLDAALALHMRRHATV